MMGKSGKHLCISGQNIMQIELRKNMKEEINRTTLGRQMGSRKEGLSSDTRGDIQEKAGKPGRQTEEGKLHEPLKQR